MSIHTLWQRLESWAEKHAPEMLDELQGPATQVEIDELEKRLQLSLPEDFKQSLLIHNGEDDGWPSRVFFENGAYLPVPAIYNDWKMLQEAVQADAIDRSEYDSEVNPKIKPVMFSKGWIPIMNMNGDVFHAIDMDPGETGVAGQIIQVDWECDVFEVIAHSFTEFLQKYIEALESGKIEIELDKSVNIKTEKKLDEVGINEYFTNDANETFLNYQKQIKYVEEKTNIPELKEQSFNDGDEITLYGTVQPDHDKQLHKFTAFYIGTLPIHGNLDALKEIKGTLAHHVFAIKLKVSLKKYLFIHVRKYTILDIKELDPKD